MISKTQNGVKKCVSLRMCLNLNDYQFKTIKYNYRLTYINPMVTANEKPTVDTQKSKIKEHKHTTK